jgi:uncharacterized protein YjdB
MKIKILLISWAIFSVAFSVSAKQRTVDEAKALAKTFLSGTAAGATAIETPLQSLLDCWITVDTVTYNGATHPPTVTITDPITTQPLVQDTHYTVAYNDGDSISAGTYQITIEGIGDYWGSTVDTIFIIKPLSLKDTAAHVTVTVNGVYTYTGFVQNVEDSVVVTRLLATNLLDTLECDVDYEISTNSKDAGPGNITITGKGNYSGTVDTTFTIQPLQLTATVVNPGSIRKVYDGTDTASVKLTPGNPCATDGGPAKLSIHVDSAVYDNKNVGTNKTITITKISLSGTRAFNYLAPDTAIYNDGSLKGAIDSADYEVTCDTLEIVKTLPLSSVVLYGLGVTVDAVTDTVCGTFTWFNNADHTDTIPDDTTFNELGAEVPLYWKFTATTPNYTQEEKTGDSIIIKVIDGQPQVVTFTPPGDSVKTTFGDIPLSKQAASDVEDATITYTSADTTIAKVDSVTGVVTVRKAGTTTITATAAAVLVPQQYMRTDSSYTLTVSRRPLEDDFVSLEDREFTYDGTAQKPGVTVTNGEENLINGTDFAVSYVDSVDAGENTGKIIIEGIGNYTDTVDTTFTIKPRLLTANAVTPISKVYDGTDTAYVTLDPTNLVSGDVVSVIVDSAVYADKNVGTDISITIKGISLSGDRDFNYLAPNTATYNDGTLTGEIDSADYEFELPALVFIQEKPLSYILVPDSAKGVTVNGVTERVEGDFKWYSENTRTIECNPDTSFNTGEIVSLWWKFTPTATNTNYVSKDTTGSVSITAVAGLKQSLTFTLTGDATLDGDTVRAIFGDGFNYSATTAPDGGAITYSSADDDVALVYSNGTVATLKADTTTITVTVAAVPEKDYVQADSSYTLIVSPRQLEDDFVFPKDSVFTYTGDEQEPVVTVKNGATNLVEETDFTVNYENNVDAGEETGKIIIEGIGNYSGRVDTTFTIKPFQLTASIDSVSLSKIYDGTDTAYVKLTPTNLFSVDSGFVSVIVDSAVYNHTDVGINRLITIKGISLDGERATNYLAPDTAIYNSATIPLTGNIDSADYKLELPDFQIIRTHPLWSIAVPDSAKGVTVNGVTEWVRGEFKWYSDETCANETPDDTTFDTLDEVSLWWKFTPAEDNTNTNYVSKDTTGSAIIAVVEGTKQTFNFALDDNDNDNATVVGDTVKAIFGKGSFTYSATTAPDGGVITYSSADDDIATVDEVTGEVTILKADTTTITVSAAAVPGTSYMQTDSSYTLVVLPRSLETASVTLTPEVFTYNGNEQQPVVTVKYGETELTEDIDFTVVYGGNNIDAVTDTITITGQGNYMGTVDTTFTIQKRLLTADAGTPIYKVYDGTDTAYVTLEATNLADRDLNEVFVIVDSAVYDNKNVGENKTITITKISLGGGARALNYLAPDTATYNIIPLTGKIDPANYEFELPDAFQIIRTLPLSSISVPDSAKGVTVNGVTEWVKGTFQWYTDNTFATEYPDNTTFGEEDEVSLWWKFTPAEDSTNYVSENTTGSATITVIEGLEQNLTFNFSGNGNATLEGDTVRAIFGYSFEYSATTTDGGEITYVSADTTIAKVDSVTGVVTVRKADTTTITIKVAEVPDKYYMAAESSYTLIVSPRPLEAGFVTLTDVEFTYDGTAHTPGVTMKNGETELMGEGEDADFTVVYGENNVDAGTKTITITGMGNYTDKVDTTFTIKPFQLEADAVTPISKIYDGTDTAYVDLELTNLVGEDEVFVNVDSAVYADKNVGTNKPITITKISLSGAQADNYLAPDTSIYNNGALTGEIVSADYTVCNTLEIVRTHPLSSVVLYGLGVTVGEVTDTVLGTFTWFADEFFEITVPDDTVFNELDVIVPLYWKFTATTPNYTQVEKYGPIYIKVIDGITQDVTFDSAAVVEKTFGDDPFSNQATSNVGATITYTSADDAIATVDETGLVTIHNAGTTIITATAAAVVLDEQPYMQTNSSYALTVRRKSIAGADVNISGVYTYNGNMQTPDAGNVTVTLDGEVLEFGTNYTLSGGGTNVGTYTVTVTGMGNYTGTATSTFTIERANFTYFVSPQSIPLGGTVNSIQKPTTGVGVNGETVSGTLEWFTDAAHTRPPTPAVFSNLAKRTLHWTFTTVNTNYINKVEGSTEFDVVPGMPQVILFAQAPVTKTFGDAPFTNPATNYSGGGAITYTSADPAIATVDGGTGLVTIHKAGTTVITAKAAMVPGAFQEGIDTYILTVNPRTITASNITISGSRQYNGQLQVPTSSMISVRFGSDAPLIDGTDYTVELASGGTNAGESTMRVRGIGNYGGTPTKGYTIDKVPLTIDPVNSVIEEKTYNGLTDAAVVSVAFTGFIGNERLTNADYVVTNARYNSPNVGSANCVYATVTLLYTTNAARNYFLSNSDFAKDATIRRAVIGGSDKTLEVREYHADMYTVDLSTLLPASLSSAQVQYEVEEEKIVDNYGVLETVPMTAGTGGMLLGLPVASVSSGRTAVIPIAISSENFDTFSVKITVVVSSRTEVNITASTNSSVYDGKPAGYTLTSITSTINGAALEGVALDALYESLDANPYRSSNPPVNTGTYRLTLSVAAGNPSYYGESSLMFSITQRPIQVVAADKAIPAGSEPPTLTYRVTDAVAGDVPIIGTPILTAPGVDTSLEGVYPIEVDLSGVVTTRNYVFASTAAIKGKLTVEPSAPEGIRVNGVSLSVTQKLADVGVTFDLEAYVSPVNAANKNVTWTTSNPSVAIVSNGVVTAVGEGTAVITAITEDGNYRSSCIVTTPISSPVGTARSPRDVNVVFGHSTLLVNSPDEETIMVYSFAGRLLFADKKPAGEYTFPIGYRINDKAVIVKGSTGWVKKISR